MKMAEAQAIIDKVEPEGYRVAFEVRERGILHSDYFPDDGEPLIATEEHAWELATQFAAHVDADKYVNIYVVDAHYRPVGGYKRREMHKYPPPQDC